MKLKYYLRGLGTGIFVTALILSVAFEVRITKLNSSIQNERESHSEKQSENDSPLGESESISDGNAEEQSSSRNDKQTENSDGSAEESSDETPSSGKEEATTEMETTSEPETAPEAEVSTAMPQSAMVTLDIYSGMSSNKVAKRLEELGVVEDADDFNNYMYSHRVENSIRTGKFEIGQDATYDEIVAIITGR